MLRCRKHVGNVLREKSLSTYSLPVWNKSLSRFNCAASYLGSCGVTPSGIPKSLDSAKVSFFSNPSL